MIHQDEDLQEIIEQENIENYNNKRKELREKAKHSLQKTQDENGNTTIRKE